MPNKIDIGTKANMRKYIIYISSCICYTTKNREIYNFQKRIALVMGFDELFIRRWVLRWIFATFRLGFAFILVLCSSIQSGMQHSQFWSRITPYRIEYLYSNMANYWFCFQRMFSFIRNFRFFSVCFALKQKVHKLSQHKVVQLFIRQLKLG